MKQRPMATIMVALIVCLALLTNAPTRAQASGADVSLVLAALQVLKTNYIKPVDATRLLNAAIAALRKATNQGTDVLPDIPSGTQEPQAIGIFRQAFAQAVKSGAGSETDLAYTATREMLDSLHDSHVGYLTATAFKMKEDALAGKLTYAGIGMQLDRKQGVDGNEFYVANVFPGSPAAAGGLRRLDKITAVNGSPIPSTAVSDEVAGQVRGPAGSTVTLAILRGSQPMTFTIMRGPIQFPGVEARIIQKGVAYVKLYSFSTGVADQVRNTLKQFMAQETLQAVILDLRGNGGGLLREAENLAGIFLPPQTTLVRVLHRSSEPTVLTARGDTLLPKATLVVLTDRFTASSSEVVVEGLKNAHRATIVGEKSAGELGAARDVSLPVGGMSVTISEVVGPNNEQIERVGIAPDNAVELSVGDLERGVDTQLDAALKTVGGVILPALAAA